MLVAEGVGRQIDPSINIWELTRPLIERWILENKSPKVIMQRAALDAWQLTERLSTIAKNTEALICRLSTEGLKLDAITIEELRSQKKTIKNSNYAWPLFGLIFLVLFLSVYF